MDELSKQYNPKKTEDRWYRFWEENGYFRAQVNPAKKPFCIVIPPPNVTGILHMGHALNNTIQDILIRYHRMKGEEALWMPGTDHAGIATQNVVERAIAKEGFRRQDLGREKFLQRVWQWKEQYGSTIIHQLKKLGCSCDWSRTRFTMDKEYSTAVTAAFERLYKKGFIYRGNYIINWCPRCQTALSDEEAPHQEIKGNLYYIKYPIKGVAKQSPLSRKDRRPDFLVVATTRPETMLGDTAVAVNPKDIRYKKYIGQSLILPLIKRQIKIIADDMVDRKFGTGAVKVTPAHDRNDYVIGKKHQLDFINILHPDGRLNENAGNYRGMHRFEAREAVLKDLKEEGLLEKVESHQLSAGHCYRCHTIIEPYLSLQWFVRMESLAKSAIEVVEEDKIRLYPRRWKKVYLNWMKNIQDWCISRQIWWGHRLPVYYCKNCQQEGGLSKGVIVSQSRPEKCPECGSIDIYQDEDVLDTWFSSWLWPFATFNWPGQLPDNDNLKTKNRQPKSELNYFYPTSVLVTAPEILFFWVARMIMSGLEFISDIPFKDVYIHGTVRDIQGRKMSKSLGNSIDPLEIISKYGTDALRFCLASCASQGDLFLSQEKFEMGRNFANKLWNASRFVMMNLQPDRIEIDPRVFLERGELKLVDRWILSRFYSMLKTVSHGLDLFRINEAANLFYAFFWHEFCDWYLEIVKNHLTDSSSQLIMYKVLEESLRVLHPFMPFVTEEIWQRLVRNGTSIMIGDWPRMQEEMIDKKLESQMMLTFDVIKAIRNLRSQIHLKLNQTVTVSCYPYKKEYRRFIENNLGLIINQAKLTNVTFLNSPETPSGTVSDITKIADVFLHFAGLVDVDKEKLRIKDSMDKQRQLLKIKKIRMRNSDFVNKAPREIVEKERQGIVEIEDTIKRLEQMYNELQ